MLFMCNPTTPQGYITSGLKLRCCFKGKKKTHLCLKIVSRIPFYYNSLALRADLNILDPLAVYSPSHFIRYTLLKLGWLVVILVP